MFLHNWLHSFRTPKTHRCAKHKRRFVRLQLERLEARLTPAPIVLTAADGGQLQTDIGTANANLTQQYIIQLTGSTYQLTAQQAINNTAGVTIEGLGAASAAIINAANGQ